MNKVLKHPYKFKKYGLNEKRQIHFIHLALIFLSVHRELRNCFRPRLKDKFLNIFSIKKNPNDLSLHSFPQQ